MHYTIRLCMQKYIDQLLCDIDAAIRPPQPIDTGPAELEVHFEEIDRYLNDEPETTLGDHCGFQSIQFPETEKLTEAQQKSLVQALSRLYHSYGVGLDIPESLPIFVQYNFYVAALDKRCFVSNWGMTQIEYCGYDFDFCPFGYEHCVCIHPWLELVEAIRQQRVSEWTEMDWMEYTWYQVITMMKRFQEALARGNSPNKERVMALLANISKAGIALKEENGTISCDKWENEAPGAEYRQLFEWIGLPPAVFPAPEELTEIELSTLGFALAWLYGKEYLTISLMQVSPAVRYTQLVRFFTAPMRKEGRMHFYLDPVAGKPIEAPDFLEQIGLRSGME
jgi:hypothetical protein